MIVRATTADEEIAAAVAIDRAVIGTGERADYIARIAAAGGLTVAGPAGQVWGFACSDIGMFFHRPFLALLIVDPTARRQGLGRALLLNAMAAADGLWTSTNESNAPMQALLAGLGWRLCGRIDGLDPGDPEIVFRAP